MYSYIDMHCDTLLQTLHKGSSLLYENEGMQSLKLMHEAKQMCQFFAIFFPPRQENKENPTPTDEEFFRILCRNFYEEIEKHPYTVAFAHNYDDIRKNWEKGLSSAILTVEDGRMVDGKMENLKMLYEQGVRAIALTWNFSNCFGYPNSEDKSIMQKGLTDFGKDALAEMNQRGILIDVSHLSDGGFYNVAEHARDVGKPFVASHSNCRVLSPATRNLTDEMIRILADCGGVAGLNFEPTFLNEDRSDTLSRVERMCDHILHLIDKGGVECVGIGTDFDGIGGQFEICDCTGMPRLFDALHARGLSWDVIEKIAYENVARVIREAL